MTARFFVDLPLQTGHCIDLPERAARHVQVLRMQPGQSITLFNGTGGEFITIVENIGRKAVAVKVGAHNQVEREASQVAHLALGMPANERMDWLVEKAVELGVASIQPLMTERSVLRLSGDRAEKKQAHWQAVAQAACEQCGRNRVPAIHAPAHLSDWLKKALPLDAHKLLLSLRPGSDALAPFQRPAPAVFLSGPEGGLAPSEEELALDRGFKPVLLCNRVLRAETAALLALARIFH